MRYNLSQVLAVIAFVLLALAAVLQVHAAQREAQQALAWHAQPRFAAERMLLKMRQAVGRK